MTFDFIYLTEYYLNLITSVGLEHHRYGFHFQSICDCTEATTFTFPKLCDDCDLAKPNWIILFESI